MNYFDILLAKKLNGGGGDITVESLSVTQNGTYTAPQGKAYTPVTVSVQPPENSYQLKSITTPTSLATFNASAMPMPTLKALITAKQASGTPSPSNPLPISGWDEVKVLRTGKNLLDPNNLEQGSFNSTTGAHTSSTRRVRTKTGILLDRGSYVVSTSANLEIIYYVYDENGTYLPNESMVVWITSNISVITLQGKRLLELGFRFSDDAIMVPSDVTNPMLEKGSQATTYEPYNGVTTTITLPQTVYGGELDVVNGVLRITWKSVDMGSLTWSYSPTYTRFSSTGVQDEIKSGNNQDEVMCSCYGNESNVDMNAFKTTTGLIMVKDSRYTDTTDFKQSVTGQQFAYMLETPIIIPLTPTLIKSLNGQNNLSVDCGEILEGEYFKALGGA